MARDPGQRPMASTGWRSPTAWCRTRVLHSPYDSCRYDRRAGVMAAIAEFDCLGREAFLRAAGFGHARAYFLEYDGRLYDSKAIVGYAHGASTGTPLSAKDFSGW